MNLVLLKLDLERDEGRKSTVYTDTMGVPTLGIGHNGSKPLSREAIDLIFSDDVRDAIEDLDRNIPWWTELSESRQRALCNMCFQLGWPRLSGFQKMLEALKARDYAEAARQAGASMWATQAPTRAKRIIDMIREG